MTNKNNKHQLRINSAKKAIRFNADKIEQNKIEGKLLFEYNQILQGKIKKHINQSYKLIPTLHAMEQAQEEKFGSFDIPTTIPSRYTVQELEQTRGKSTKFVIRFEYNRDYDMQLVLRHNYRTPGTYKVITAWLIEADNYHTDVDMTPYSTPDKVVY